MRTVAIVQARMTSTRLPGKVLMPFGDGSVLRRVMTRLRMTPGLDALCVAIPDGDAHQPVVDEALAIGDITVCRGSELDVLDRYARAAETCRADFVLRVTSDCPMIDPGLCGAVLATAISTNGYARTAFDTGYPLGLDCEALPIDLLLMADKKAVSGDEREHVTPFIWRNPDRFPQTLLNRTPDRRLWRLTLDEPSDYQALTAIDAALGPDGARAGFSTVERLLLAHPELLTINSDVRHKHVAGSPIAKSS